MNKRQLVVQHNKLVEARYKLTLEEQRLIKTLVANIQPGDEDFKVYEIRVLDLAKLIGLTDDYYYNKIKVLTKRLRDSSLTFVNENGDEVQTGWLSSAIYRKGKGSVELRFDPILKPYLLQLKHFFTSYELGNILRLKGNYSIRMYELLKQYQKVGSRKFDVCKLRQILQVESEYQEYKDFKRYVIVPSEREISKKTDISCTFTEQKEGRRVVSLTFYIKSNIEGALIESNISETNAEYEEPKSVKSTNNIVDILIDFGVLKRTAETLFKEYGEDRIKIAIAYTEAQKKEGKVKSPSGFLIDAIKNEYRDTQAEERSKKEKAKKAREDKKKQEQELKDKDARLRRQAIDSFLNALTQEQLQDLKQAFVEEYKSNIGVSNMYKKAGFESRVVMENFRDFLFKTKLSSAG